MTRDHDGHPTRTKIFGPSPHDRAEALTLGAVAFAFAAAMYLMATASDAEADRSGAAAIPHATGGERPATETYGG